MAKLSSLGKLIKAGNPSPEVCFLNDLIKTIQNSNKPRIPSQSYKPSSLGGCLRNIYFQMTGATLDGTPCHYALAGICESGTDRHDKLQHYVASMKEFGIDCEWVDVEQYVNEYKPEGTTILNKSGMETKCFNELYNLRFLCDGIIKYKGEYYILEIKTESTYKFSSHDEPFEAHKVQASTYSLCFGIDKVLFLYENRDNTTKKAYLVDVTKDMKQYVVDKITKCNEHIAKQVAPAKTSNPKDCQYCDYKRECRLATERNSIPKCTTTKKKPVKIEF